MTLKEYHEVRREISSNIELNKKLRLQLTCFMGVMWSAQGLGALAACHWATGICDIFTAVTVAATVWMFYSTSLTYYRREEQLAEMLFLTEKFLKHVSE